MTEMTEDMIERFIDRCIAEYGRLPSSSTIEYISGGFSPLKILQPSPPYISKDSESGGPELHIEYIPD
jgi:hypothetical protein